MKKLFITMLFAMSVFVTPSAAFASQSTLGNVIENTVEEKTVASSRMAIGERFYYTEPGHIDIKPGDERVLFLGSQGWWRCRVISVEHIFNIKKTTEGYYQAIAPHHRF